MVNTMLNKPLQIIIDHIHLAITEDEKYYSIPEEAEQIQIDRYRKRQINRQMERKKKERKEEQTYGLDEPPKLLG